MKETPNYFAIIPAEVRYDVELKDKAKLLYGEIVALSDKNGYCYASNKYFSELYNISITSVSLLIKNLIEKGYLESEILYKENSKEIDKRYLRIVKGGYLSKVKGGIKEKLKDNNTSINNTSINNNIYSAVINYLNKKTNQHYKENTPKTRNLINARVNEGFTLEDFKEVIKKKTIEWKNTKMEMYLRPETLFGTKFESYLNQKGSYLPEWFEEEYDIEENNSDKEYMEELLKNFK